MRRDDGSIYKCHDDAKDKDFELEISWICPESGGKHQTVPAEIVAVRNCGFLFLPNVTDLACTTQQEAGRKAKEALDDEMED